jgi:hypothetical protein
MSEGANEHDAADESPSRAIISLAQTARQDADRVASRIEEIPAADGADVLEVMSSEKAADVAEVTRSSARWSRRRPRRSASSSNIPRTPPAGS